MGSRTVYGNQTGENGWPFVDEAGCQWITVPGTDVNLEIQQGEPLSVMRAFAADFNAYVEPLRDADSACWTATNSVATSNHLGGTAMDLNWDSHPFQVADAGFDPGKIATVRELLDWYEGTIFWGNDWDSPKDAMHFQMGYNTFNNPHTADFVTRKIRADGFSTFRRGDAPPPPPPSLSRADGYALAIIQEGQRRNITERGIKIALATALVETNLTMYANSNDPASLGLPHDAVGSDHMSVGLFQQQNFPPWPDLPCRMDAACSAGGFYAQLVKLDYNNTANSPGSYAQDVQGSAFPDRYDQRYDEASALYDRLAGAAPAPPPVPAEEDWMSALTPDEQRELLDKIRQSWGAWFNKEPSKSRYGDPQYVWGTNEYIHNMDGHVFDLIVEHNAALGDAWSIAAVQKAASAGDAIAQHFLAQLGSAPAPGLGPVALPGPAPSPGPFPPPVTPSMPLPPPAPSPQKITLLTFSGHMADMNTGYPADLARAMDPHVFYHQPVGNWDVNALPLGPPTDAAFNEGLRLLQAVHPSGPWAIAAYSQGAIAASRLYMETASGGQLANRADDFVGAVTWGNPCREQGSCVGHDPGGHGISSTRIVGTGPRWHDYADPGDLYTNVSGPSGDDCTAVYDLIMTVNPMALMIEVLKLFTNPAPELMAMIQAIIQGITFAAGNPATAAHVSYQWRDVEPGISYWQHAVNTMRAIGAQVRSS